MYTKSFHLNKRTRYPQMHRTMLTFFLRGRNSPTSLGLTTIDFIVIHNIGIIRSCIISLNGSDRLAHGTSGTKSSRLRLTKSRRQYVVDTSAHDNGQNSGHCRQHHSGRSSHPRSSCGNSGSRSCTRLSC